MKQVLTILICTIFFASCSRKMAPDRDWARQRWVLTELRGVPVQQSGTSRDAFIEFNTAEKRYSGNGGCNRITGSYTMEKKGELKFGEVTSTRMACNDTNFESAYLDALRSVTRYSVNGNRMELRNGKNLVIVLEGR